MNCKIEQSTLFNLFDIEYTADGSPTLRLKKPLNEKITQSDKTLDRAPEFVKKTESMHHSGGAATETFYIYTSPFKRMHELILDKKVSFNEHVNIGVVGLGLAYIELSLLPCLISQQHLPEALNYKVLSFEKEDELILNFKKWIASEKNTPLYDEVYAALKKIGGFDIAKIEIFKTLMGKSSAIEWDIKGELSLETLHRLISLENRFNFVAFDAFSQSTDIPLWKEEFLEGFFKMACAEDCVFTTYACTGLLKRKLTENNFVVIKRKGFSGKRDATLALRGQFKAHQNLFENG